MNPNPERQVVKEVGWNTLRLNSTHKTLNPKLNTQNLKTQTQTLKPQTHKTLNPKHKTLNPKLPQVMKDVGWTLATVSGVIEAQGALFDKTSEEMVRSEESLASHFNAAR